MLEFQGHAGTVQALAFAPDALTLLSAGKDRTIRIWDIAAGAEKGRLEGHTGAVVCLAVHRLGKVLASGGSDSSLKLWRLPEGQPMAGYPKQMAGVTGVAWLPDRPGTLLMGCGERMQPERGGELRLWDFAAATKPANVRLDAHGFWSLAVAAHAPVVAWGGGSRSVCAWNITHQQPTSFRVPSPSLAVALSPDGNFMAASVDRAVKIFDVRKGRELTTLDAHKGLVRALAFSPGGRVLATGSQDQTVRFWSLESGTIRPGPVFQWPVGGVHALAFSPDGVLAAAAGESGSVWIWDLDA